MALGQNGQKEGEEGQIRTTEGSQAESSEFGAWGGGEGVSCLNPASPERAMRCSPP